MGSTGEPDRKRRHFSSISPTAAAAAKKHPLLPSSEDKKLDAAVLQYQNQKLVQQLEAQKAEFSALENKFHRLKEKQQTYNDTLKVVNRSWEQLVDDLELESLSVSTRDCANGGNDVKHSQNLEDGVSSPPEDTFMCRLLQTGATDSCSANGSADLMEIDIQTSCASTKSILQNIVVAINDLWCANDGVTAPLLAVLPDDEPSGQIGKTANELEMEVKNLRVALSDLHLKHRSFSNEVQSHRDSNAKNKAELNRLAGELEDTIAELEESNCKLAVLKAQRDAAQGACFPVLNIGNKHVAGDKARDKQKDLQDMESSLKEFLNLSSSRLLELRNLHEERIVILKQLANLQGVKHISSSKAYLLLSDQIEKSKAEVNRYHSLLEKQQVEKDNFIWREKEVNAKVDLAEISQRACGVAEYRKSELEKEIKRQIEERNLFETRLEEASREPGRKEIIAEFKALLSSLPKNIDIMQSQLSKYKEAASEVHCLRAEVQSLSNILDRKANGLETLSGRSADQAAELKKLQAVVLDLKESDQELKLILEMYKRESTDSRDVIESRDLEYKAWAHVQSLKSSLDEHNLELRVKAANEAEAICQQRLATAEAEIADLRQKLEASGRDICKFSEVLKSKHEEGEAYLSEIESIGQAYGDMQTQNQQLLQQITERDDYNIKLVLESVKTRQLQGTLHMEKRTMEKEMQHANASLDFYDMKAAQIEEQLKFCSEQVGKLAEDAWQSSLALENTKKRLLEVQGESQQLRQSLGESQSKVERSRLDVAELQIEVENERFNKKRTEEELDVVTRKATLLSAHTEGTSVLEKLQEEVREYKEILKCSVCHDRQKEVVITKCYHLFCGTCVQRILESRQRRCPICAASFGPNDVKNIYI
ncbi:E3 ubiquitin-protein ligase BRE1-like 1 isoform X2 [Magnolia sinica]|uniref:E3 ubiquitin-protein ligase BRE1-like 1 isoform X2 n=1 Tax=Magnolia sinica TaxID=86752 RepID=UPI002659B136|nr:E3 ubiquitin-protein ligase BRE1-like 1 isoform X2 [Magnolia sinica]